MSDVHDDGRGEAPSRVTQRTRFFDGQFLTEDDFSVDQEFNRGRLHALAAGLASPGILEGLGVSVADSGITVAPGTAIDAQGQLFVVADALTMSIDRTEGRRPLVLHWAEQGVGGSEAGVAEANRVQEVVTASLDGESSTRSVGIGTVDYIPDGDEFTFQPSYAGLDLGGSASVGPSLSVGANESFSTLSMGPWSLTTEPTFAILSNATNAHLVVGSAPGEGGTSLYTPLMINSGALGLDWGDQAPFAVEGNAKTRLDGGELAVFSGFSAQLAVDQHGMQARIGQEAAPLELNPLGGGVVVGLPGDTSSSITLHHPVEFTAGTSISGRADGTAGDLIVGSRSWTHLAIDNNEIQASNGVTQSDLFLNFGGGRVYVGQPEREGGLTVHGDSAFHNPVELLAGTSIAGKTDGTVGDLIIGSRSSTHLAIDNNEIQASNGSGNSTLFLNFGGGSVSVGGDLEVGDFSAGSLKVGAWRISQNSGDSDLEIHFGETRRAYLRDTGSSGFVFSSDARLKTDVEPLAGSLELVRSLSPSSFAFRSAPGSRGVGFMAQDVQRLAPELVSESRGMLGLCYTDFVVIAIAAIKEQQEKIDELETSIRQLVQDGSDV